MTDLAMLFLAMFLAYLLTYAWTLYGGELVVWPPAARTFRPSVAHAMLLIACLAIFYSPALRLSIGFAAWIVGYLAAHFIVDVAQSALARARTPMQDAWRLVLAQSLHVALVAAFALMLAPAAAASVASLLGALSAYESRVLIALVVYIAAIFAGGQLIRLITRPLAEHVHHSPGWKGELPNAGLFIGWLERFLIVTAVLLKSPSMIGLIFAGKSIARFREMKDERFAEYFLIGTFLSVAIALLGGVVIQLCWYGTVKLT